MIKIIMYYPGIARMEKHPLAHIIPRDFPSFRGYVLL
jgi:hypothetical protein